MSKEEIVCLINEIEPDDNLSGYIDCGVTTDYIDNGQYNRIVTALKQNIILQNKNEELNKKLEDVEKQAMEALLRIESLIKEKDETKQDFLIFMSDLCNFLSKEKNVKFPLRIGHYKFEIIGKGLLVYNYDPIKEVEPVELKITVIEKEENGTCPLCKGELGKYPAISRKDNKTEICSNCGTREALEIFYKENRDKKDE